MKDETKEKIDKEIFELSKETKKTIRFKQLYSNKVYMVTIKKPKSMDISIYLAEQIFLNELIKKPFYYGKVSYLDSEKLKLIEVLNIVEIDKPKSIFKRF